jgi:glycosyltransferase involved in cell wall biosynthesis
MALAVQGRIPRAPRHDTTGATAPRAYLFEEMFAPRYNESILDAGPRWARTRPLPGWVKLAAEIRRRGDEYDVLVTWSERVAIALMTMNCLLGSSKPFLAMMYWFSRPSVRMPIRAFGSGLHAIVTWSSVQRTYAIDHLGVPPERIYLIRHFVDQLFWKPRDCNADMICSVGAEMRDYPTLVEALRGTGIRCHIASDHVRVDRFGFARRIRVDERSARASDALTIGRKSLLELRDLYARSRFVVVPLRPSDTDNGVTVILEAMAMGKAVICSRTQGQVDVIQDGVTGIYVPPGDPGALRDAILSLWRDPERASAMGRAGRDHIEKHHTLDKFCRDVRGAAQACVEGRSATHAGGIPSALSPEL